MKKREWGRLKKWFIWVQEWIEDFRTEVRHKWVEIRGLPAHIRCYETYQNLAKCWGELVYAEENTGNRRNYNQCISLVATTQNEHMEEQVVLTVNGKKYEPLASEFHFIEESSPKEEQEENRNESPWEGAPLQENLLQVGTNRLKTMMWTNATRKQGMM